MKKLVILCIKDDSISTELVRELLLKLEGTTFLKQYTTNKHESEIYEIVPSRTFFDMVEECKFFEFHDVAGAFYGTPHNRRREGENITLMLNSVETALEIKKYSSKAITIYVLPEEEKAEFCKTKFEWTDPNTKCKLLDFLVAYNNVQEATEKIERIIHFMSENAIYCDEIM